MALVKNISTHPLDLTDGRIVDPSDTINADLSLPHEADLVASGRLVITNPSTDPPAPATRNVPVVAPIAYTDPSTSVTLDISGEATDAEVAAAIAAIGGRFRGAYASLTSGAIVKANDVVTNPSGALVSRIADGTISGSYNSANWTALSAGSSGVILPWATGTAYVTGQPVTNGGKTWLAVNNHTAGATFSGDSAHWALLPVAAGTTLAERGAWAATTAYVAGDSYTQGGIRFVVTTAYTSGGTFGATDLANTFATGAAVDDTATVTAGQVPIYNGTTGLFKPGTMTPVPGPTEAVPLYTFGHSYAVGTGASAAAYNYVNRLAGRLRSGTNTNYATGGASPETVWNAVRTNWVVGTKGLVLLDFLINEIYGTGASGNVTVSQASTQMYLRSMLRLLRTAARKRYDDASITLSNPGNTVFHAGAEDASIALNVGQTASIPSYTDTEIVILAFGSSSYASTFTVSVGGTTYGTISTGSGNGFNLETMRVTGLPAGSKTVVVTATGGAQAYFNGYMRAAGPTPPGIVLVKDCSILAWAHGGWATKAAADAELAILDGYLDTIGAEAEFGGSTQTVVADPNPAWDPNKHLYTDQLHPNNIGHAIYADAIQAALATLTYRDGLVPT